MLFLYASSLALSMTTDLDDPDAELFDDGALNLLFPAAIVKTRLDSLVHDADALIESLSSDVLALWQEHNNGEEATDHKLNVREHVAHTSNKIVDL